MSKTLQVAGKRRGKKTTYCVFYKAKRKGRKQYYIKKCRPYKKKSRKNMKRKTRALAKSIKKFRGGAEPKDDKDKEGVAEEKGDVAPPDAPPNIPYGMRPGDILQRTPP